MATGSRALESLRAGLEAVEGTPIIPTRILYPAIGGVNLSIKAETLKLDMAWAKNVATQDILAGVRTDSLTVTAVPLSYEDAHFWLSPFDANGLSAAGVVTDTSAYTRTGAPSMTDNTVSATGIKSMTIQYAPTDLLSTAGWQLAGLEGDDLVLDFKKASSGSDTGVTLTAKYVTAQAATIINSFTGTLSDRTQTFAVGNNLKCYIDTTTMGLTPDLDVTTAQFHLNKQTKYHSSMDATNAWASIHRPSGWTTQMTYTKKFSSLTEYNAYIGTLGQRTLRKVRIIAEGALIGAATAKNTIRLDFVGKYTDMGDVPQYIAEEIWAANFTLDGMYDATLLSDHKIVTINTIATAATVL